VRGSGRNSLGLLGNSTHPRRLIATASLPPFADELVRCRERAIRATSMPELHAASSRTGTNGPQSEGRASAAVPLLISWRIEITEGLSPADTGIRFGILAPTSCHVAGREYQPIRIKLEGGDLGGGTSVRKGDWC
jgi:hypothetical protein